MEIFTTGFALSWGASKIADFALKKFLESNKRDLLVQKIEKALMSEPIIITPNPTLNKERITNEVIKELLKIVLENNVESLADYLLNEQLISFSAQKKLAPEEYKNLWNQIAEKVNDAVLEAIIQDDDLSRMTNLLSHQKYHRMFQKLLTDTKNPLGELIGQDRTSSQIKVSEQNELSDTSGSDVAVETIVSLDTASAISLKLMADKVEQLDQQNRDEMDDKAENKWNQILDEIHKFDFHKAVSSGEELHGWLMEKKESLSASVRGRTYLLLAQIALIESMELDNSSSGYKKSNDYLTKACDSFGAEISEENQLRLSNFKAKLLFLEGNTKQAYELLDENDDPQIVSTRLLIYIDSNEYQNGIDLIEGKPFNEKWCDSAVFLHARVGNREQAYAYLNWAKENCSSVIQLRCRVFFARGTIEWLKEVHGGSKFSILSLNEDAKGTINNILTELAPIVEQCNIQKTINNGLENEAVGFAYSLYRMLGQVDQSQRYVKYLASYHPLHLVYVDAVFRGDVEPDQGLSEILRNDYSQLFVARRMAIEIDIFTEKDTGFILDRIKEEVKNAKSILQREELGKIVIQTTWMPGFDSTERAKELVKTLVGEDHFLYSLCESNDWLQGENIHHLEKAISKYDGENDYLLDQFRAEILSKKGNKSQAANLLLRIGRDMADPFLLKKAANVAMQDSPPNYEVAISALDDALALSPKDQKALELLSHICMQLQGFEKAADCFARLRRIESNNLRYMSNHAQCCVLAFKTKEAIEIYEELCSNPIAPLESHLAYATLLSYIGSPDKAFNKLNNIRDKYWNEPVYVYCYIDVAYRASEVLFAKDGLQQLSILSEAGVSLSDQQKTYTRDSIVEDAEKTQKHYLISQSLNGKLPWLTLENHQQKVPYWGWRVRTRPLAWKYDDALNRAFFSIYATNSFAALFDEDGKTLKQINCSPKDNPVVSDLSSLMTLHQLGLLKEAIDYFGNIKIPPSYLANVLQDSGKLQPGKPFQFAILNKIKGSIEANEIQIKTTEEKRFKVLNEHSDEGEADHYRIRDLLLVLKSKWIGRSQEKELEAIALKPALSPDLSNKLSSSDHIVVDLSTLQLLAGQELLEVLCIVFDRISITDEDYKHLNLKLRDYGEYAETLSWHNQFWEMLTSDNRVDTSTIIIHGDGEPEKLPGEFDSFDAFFLAKQEKLPLLTDDRACQNLFLVLKNEDESASFGTDRLIYKMFEVGLISQRQLSRAYLQLIDWRYRFLIVPAPVLKEIACEFAEYEFQKIASYLHDCMRDPGLFGGQEPTNPPISMALRFYQGWLTEIAIFVADLWLDEFIDDNWAVEKTDWVMKELIPCLPLALSKNIAQTADITPFTIIYQTLNQLCQTNDYKRANKALKSMAKGLGLKDEEFIRTAMDVIDSSWQVLSEILPDEDDESIRSLQSRMLRHVIHHLTGTFDSRTAMIVIKNSLIKPIPQSLIPEHIVEIIEDPEHKNRWPGSYGPYILARNEKNVREMIELNIAILTPDLRLRKAGLAELDRQMIVHTNRKFLFLSPQTKIEIDKNRDDLLSDDTQKCLTASIKTSDLLEEDFFYQMAGFKQSLLFNLGTEVSTLLKRLLTPSEETIQFLRELPIWSPLRQHSEIEELLIRIIEKSSTLSEVLSEYFRLFGHIPLTGKISAGGVVAAWADKHGLPEDPGKLVLDWVSKNSSPLVRYHACQILCHNPTWVLQDHNEVVLDLVSEIVNSKKSNEHWNLRCDLSRHFCRHLETINTGADSERLAAFSWWLAENLAHVIESYAKQNRETCNSILSDEFSNSEALWTVVRLPVSRSSLRYMSIISHSVWATSILCEFIDSNLSSRFEPQCVRVLELQKLLFTIPYIPVGKKENSLVGYSFESSNIFLEKQYSKVKSSINDENDRLACTTIIDARSELGFEKLLRNLPSTDENSARAIAYALYIEAMCGSVPGNLLYELFSDHDWRNAVLINHNEEVITLVCNAVIEVALSDKNNEWDIYLPHYFALSCEANQQQERKERLFNYVVISSIATITVSAIERILKSSDRRSYAESVEYWRKKIEEISPNAPAWISAKLRDIKSVLYIN
ncbi:tetratricopeptide repeat protein [Gimesia maris]|uniref:tetratricopeptide repeat protein n=1 Tax=Gimesia maris TaxID=122 RepID=UPI0032ECCD49